MSKLHVESAKPERAPIFWSFLTLFIGQLKLISRGTKTVMTFLIDLSGRSLNLKV